MAAPLILLAALLAAEPVPAAEVPGDMVQSLKERVVEAIRNCPKAAPGEIIVCSRDRGVAEGYRLPKIADRFDYRGEKDSVSRERHRLMEGGEAGAGSCSTVGAGGWTGCLLRQWQRGDQQRAGQ
jgi:hypothetical protein